MNLLNRRKDKTRLTLLALCVLLVSVPASVIAGGNGEAETIVTYEAAPRQVVSMQTTPSPSGLAALEALQNQFRLVSEMVLPVVVEVNVVDVITRQERGTSPFNFFGQRNDSPRDLEYRQQGMGSGVIVGRSEDTVYVLTNDHVVASADEISLTLYDGRTFEATIIGSDSRKDLAVVTFTTKEEVPIAVLGNSDSLMVGDWVFAIGNPLGFESTVTSGIVSALGRRPDNTANFTDYIQTDAAINQGNSGGALVNLYGEVVGINSWIASNSGGSIGLGFSIPINTAKRAIEDFIESGEIAYGWLGITVGTIGDVMKSEFGYEGLDGGFVYNIAKDSPADKSGLLPGDLITRIGDTTIADSNELVLVVGNISPGETQEFEIHRFDETLTIDVTIGLRNEEQVASSPWWPGIGVSNLSDSIREQVNIPTDAGNIVVGEVNTASPAYTAGMRNGDIIKELNGIELEDIREFYETVNTTTENTLRFSVYRLGSDRRGSEITITVPRD
jgi:serine protease Do